MDIRHLVGVMSKRNQRGISEIGERHESTESAGVLSLPGSQSTLHEQQKPEGLR